MPSASPYAGMSPDGFWRLGVAQHAPGALPGLYRSRFSLSRETRIAIAGECFAQRFARMLGRSAANLLDCEPPPPGLPDEMAQRHGYKIFSARHGNIYFIRQLRQLIDEAYGRHVPEDAVWELDGRHYDALRPSVEPAGLDDPAEVVADRQGHLVALREMFESTDVFIYTFGLNEAWVHAASGTVYPTAPGTVAGAYDPGIHHLHVFTYPEVYEDFNAVAAMLREVNPRMRILVMVSPVPGTATATGMHVLAATTQHKAILRVVAGAMTAELDFVDYFPAFELIATPFSRGQFYESNRRALSAAGLDAIIEMFLAQHPDLAEAAAEPKELDENDYNACEDALLDAFAP